MQSEKKRKSQRFLDYSLSKKVNITLFGMVIMPVFFISVFIMIWMYQTNISTIYTEKYRSMGEGITALEECFEHTEDLPLICMQAEFLQRIGTGHAIGRDYVKIREWLNEIYSKNPCYENICISLNNGKQFQAGNYMEESMEEVEKRIGVEQEKMWIVEKKPKYALQTQKVGKESLITFQARIEQYYDLGQKKTYIGTISVRLKEPEIRGLYEEKFGRREGRIFLIDGLGTLLSSTDKDMFYEDTRLYSDIIDCIEGKRQGKYWKDSTILFYQYSKILSCYLVNQISVYSLYGNVMYVILIFFLSLLLCLAFCIIFGKIQRRYVTEPIFELVKVFGEMEHAEFIRLPNRSRKDEIGILQNSFNQMAEKLDTLINQVYRADYARQEAQLRALTEQINPHFLYNTLDSIHWKAIRNKDIEVAEQILALSDVYRYLLNKGNDFICIRDEVKFQERYLYLMNMRYGERIRWEQKIDEAVLDICIPKLIVQPLIENAIVHGIEPSLEGGDVILEIRLDKKALLLQVQDTGVGFGKELFLCNDEIETEKGAFALKNINERLKLYYSDGYQYTVQSRQSGGCSVSIRIDWERVCENSETDDCRR